MKRRGAFSVVEVVVAVGVFAGGVVGAIVLMTATTRTTTATLEANGALRVAESSASLVRLLPWEAVVARLDDPEAGAVHATREGRTGWFETVAAEEAFYVVELMRNPELSPVTDDASAAFLAIQVRVSWPVFSGDGAVVPLANRELVILNAAVRR